MSTIVHVQYFAVFREKAACTKETRTTEAATLSDLYTELSRDHGFSLPPDQVRFAVNEDYVPQEARVEEGMTVTLIPPVAGG